MEADCMEAPVVDVQEELNGIARLAGLAPKMEAKCSSCGCADCQCDESVMDESTRKHFQHTASTIKALVDAGEVAKAKEKANAAVEIYSRENPRFDQDKFYKACGLDIEECGMAPATILVGEEEMEEGNEFTKARLDAIAQGKDSFTVGGKAYKVSGDTSDEKTQVESIDDEKQAVTENMNITVAADGEEDVVNLIRKLSGMPVVAVQASPIAEEYCDACDSTECHCEEAIEEERDIEWDNTPEEKTAPITAVTTDAGGGLGGVKKQYPLAANRGANPIEENLWKAYEDMINDVKV
jgi:hypothetical protein